ncbi:hypothetical protein [Breoghania sp. JC706]|uniref:hypothetical protein n=1 Tax=Breoghania sp. JC706 TaxID=3117732 RepID=UPI00300B74C3
MLTQPKTPTSTASVTLTLDISFEAPRGTDPLSSVEIDELAQRAVASITDMTWEKIAAFNEISRVRRGARGKLVSVEARQGGLQTSQSMRTSVND